MRKSFYSTSIAIKLERHLVEIIEKDVNSFYSKIVRSFLFLVSLCFRFAIALKNFFYDQKILSSEKQTIPLICVGNIRAGGSGKTPFIELLLRYLTKEKKIALLSRAYRSKGEEGSYSLTDQPELQRADFCGDEVFMLLQKHPQIECMIGKNRIESLRKLAPHKVDLALFDDGLQFRKLSYDRKVIMLPSHDLFGKGYFLPRGYLRDHPKQLKHADLLVIHGAKSEEEFEMCKKQVRSWSNSPIIGTRSMIRNVVGDQPGKRASLFCALGSPQKFMEDVKEQLQFDIVGHHFLSDHHLPTPKKLAQFADLSKENGADFLLCSEKDFVKLTSQHKTSIPICYTQAEMEVVFEKENFEKFLYDLLHLGKGRAA